MNKGIVKIEQAQGYRLIEYGDEILLLASMKLSRDFHQVQDVCRELTESTGIVHRIPTQTELSLLMNSRE